jgi:predicted lactoylglutathione lyase
VEARISLITLGVADVGASRRFYERLGFVASPASQAEVAFFQIGGLALALYGRASLAADAGVDAGTPGLSAVTLAQNLRSEREVDEVYAQALAAGAKPTQPPKRAEWGGYVGYFADPDGHLWELAWNPSFPLDDDGNLHLPA